MFYITAIMFYIRGFCSNDNIIKMLGSGGLCVMMGWKKKMKLKKKEWSRKGDGHENDKT